MTQYQRITLKESGEEIVVSTMEYPYAQAGILYIKFIKYSDITLTPEMFVTLQPQDILKREYGWTQEAEDELVAASEHAAEQEIVMRETYQKAAEGEMARRSALIKPPDEEAAVRGDMFG